MSGTQEFKQTINDYDRREKKAIAMSPQFSLKSTVGASDWRGRSVSVATRIQKQPAIVHFHTTAPPLIPDATPSPLVQPLATLPVDKELQTGNGLG
jgi:hypothetical protein